MSTKSFAVGSVLICSLIMPTFSMAQLGGHAASESVFGSIRYGAQPHVYERTSPKNEGAYSLISNSSNSREYVSFDPKGSMYLVENLIHGCKKTYHLAVDRVRAENLEARLTGSKSSNGLDIQVLSTVPTSREDMMALQRLLKSGIDVRLQEEPILNPFSICDEKHVISGVHETFSTDRYSFGSPSVEVSYGNKQKAREYEIRWHSMWGNAKPLPMMADADNAFWRILGSEIIEQNNRPVYPYAAGSDKNVEYNRAKTGWSFKEFPLSRPKLKLNPFPVSED